MKTFYKTLTLSLLTLIYTACGGGSSSNSNSSTPSTRTMNIHVQQSSTLSSIANANLKIYDTSGTQVNASTLYTTNATGDVTIVVSGTNTVYNIKVIANTYVDQIKVVTLATSSTTLNETISLLPVAGTVTSPIVGINVDPSGSGAEVDTTGAIFYDTNGVIRTIDSIEFTPLNPIANPDAFPGTPDITMPNGTAGIMVSSGMIDIVFKDASGNPLNLTSPNVTPTPVSITMPLYSNINPITGNVLVPNDAVRFWSMNPTTGVWSDEEDATVVSCTGSPTGLCAKGNVEHFSFWNTDFAISATRKETIVINSATNQAFDVADIDSIRLTAKFTEATPGAGYYGTTSIRGAYIEVDDFIKVGDNFDAKFTVDILFTDGTRATKPFEYTWTQIDALNEFQFNISKTDQFVDIDISTYEDSYSVYRNHPLYINRTFIGISASNVDMKVNGILNGNPTVGITSCGYDIHDDWHYCTYTKGTQSGIMTITAQSQLDSAISDSITIDVKATTPKLALKSSYKYSTNSSAGNSQLNTRYYYQDTSIYLSKQRLQNATSLSDYEYTYSPSSYKLVLDKPESILLTDYTLAINCVSNTGSACAADEEFTSPFTFDVSKFPAGTTANRSNVYTLTATKNSDATVSTSLGIIYY